MDRSSRESHRRAFLLGLTIFALAFALRLTYLLQIRDTPLFDHPIADSAGFDAWSDRILGGDWFGTAPTDPGMSEHSAPIYPAFLALAKSLCGHDWFRIRALQMLVGSLSCVLVFIAGRTLLGRVSGALAGLLLAASPPAIYYDGLIQKGVLAVLFLSALLALVGSAQRRPTAAHFLGLGLCLALLTLDRENAVILLPVLLAWVWLRFGSRSAPTRLGWIASVLVGMAAVYLPVTLRNWRATGALGAAGIGGANLGANFYIGNGADADGAYVPLRPGHGSPAFERQDAFEIAEEHAGRPLTPAEVSRFWVRRAWRDIRNDPGRWIRLLGHKWLLVWNRLEISDAEDLYLQGESSSLLAGLDRAFHFGVLTPLAAAGAVLTWRQRRDVGVLYAVLLALACSVAAFFVLGRYRYPLVPVLVIFAGAAPFALRGAWREHRRMPVVAAAVAGLACATASNWPLRSRERQIITARMNLATALSEMNRLDEAARLLERVIAARPSLAEAHHNLGNVRAKMSDFRGAAADYRQALRVEPDLVESHIGLADALRKLEQPDEAVRHYARAAELRPRSAVAHFKLGVALAQIGANERAAESFRRAIELDPDMAAAWYNLATTLIELNRRDQAIDVLRRAARQHPGDHEMNGLLDHLLNSARPEE